MTSHSKVPTGWSETTFGDVVESIPINEKKIPTSSYLSTGRFPVIDQGQSIIAGYCDDETKVVGAGLPVIVFGDHTRTFKYLDRPFVPGADGIKVLKPSGVNAKWLFHIAHALEFPNKGYARHFQYLKAARLLLPPFQEQELIVAAIEKQFTRLDAGVAASKRVLTNLKRYRAAVLKAASEGRIGAEGHEHWRHGALGDILFRIEAGKSFRCEERPPLRSETGVVKVSAVTWGKFAEYESKTCIDAARLDPRYLIQTGDFLFSRANTIDLVGACVIAERVNLRLMLSDKVLRLQFVSDVEKRWVLYWLRSERGRREIQRLATGNQDSMRNIGQERIRQIAMDLPPLQEQQQIVAEIERRLSLVEVLEQAVIANLRRAKRLRQSLLQRAFFGNL